MGAGDLGPGYVVDEHVFDGAFATLDIWNIEVRLVVVVVVELVFGSLLRYAPIALIVAILESKLFVEV